MEKIGKILVFLVSIITFGLQINKFPLRNWDEAWYAEMSRNMALGSKSFLVPFWNGNYYFDKPPLYFWLTTPVIKLFGNGEWQSRIVSVLAATGASFLVYLTAKKLFDEKIALLSLFAFLTLGQLVARFSEGNLDSLLTFFTIGSFYTFLLSEDDRKFTAISGTMLGLGFLTKGIAPGLLAIFAILIYSLISKRFLLRGLPILILYSLLPFTLWSIFGTFRFGKQFLEWYILNPEAGILRSPLSSFSISLFKDLIRDVGFWWIFVFLGFLASFKLKSGNRRIPASFFIVIVLFTFGTSFLSEKFGWFLLPSYAFIAIIIGNFISNSISVSKFFIPLVFVIFTAQVFLIQRIKTLYPDASEVGSELGRIAKEIVPKENLIILDDSDFPTFLYYSEHQKILVADLYGGKPNEWWIKDYTKMLDLILKSENVWVVTKDSFNTSFNSREKSVEKVYYGYYFLKYE